jgi:hypothetical protein
MSYQNSEKINILVIISGNRKIKLIPDLSEFNYETYMGCQIGQDLTRVHMCLGCNYTASRKTTVKRHLLAVHRPNQMVKCSICDGCYKNSEQFRDHFRQRRHLQAVQLAQQLEQANQSIKQRIAECEARESQSYR